MAKISDYVKEKIWNALNNEEGAEIVRGRSMSIVKCPKCGGIYSHFFIKDMETSTKNGGYVFGWEFECSCCPPMMFVVAEHKGQCVYGQVVKGITLEGLHENSSST